MSNTKRPFFIFRGTKDFVLQGSDDAVTWVDLATGTLEDPELFGACDEPLETIVIDNKYFRYIQFTAVNFYGEGAALHYLDA